MKIIKPVLLGPKLIAVGPLKCFKGGGGGSSGGGGSRGGGGGKGGGGSSSSSSSGSKGGTGEQSAQQREAQLQTDALKKKQAKEEEERVKSETSMGGQLAGMDFSDIKRDPVTGKQTGEAKKRDDRTFGEKAGGFLKGLAAGTFSTDADEQQAAFDKAEAENVSKRAGRTVSVEEMKEFEEAGGGSFGGPSAKEFFGQKDQATREGVKDFVFTDQAEVARLEEEEKAAADLQKARELEAKRVEEEVSPFTKQLAGVDLEKADFAREMRETPLEERRKLMLDESFDTLRKRKKAAQEKRMSFFDKLVGRKPEDMGFQSARIGPDEIEKMEQKYQLTEDDIGTKEYYKDSGFDTPEAQAEMQKAVQKERDFIKDQKELRELSELNERQRIADETSPFGRQLQDIRKEEERKRLIEADAPDQAGIRQAMEQKRLIEADSPDQVGIRQALAEREKEQKRLIEADAPDQVGIRQALADREAVERKRLIEGDAPDQVGIRQALAERERRKKEMDAGSQLQADYENKVRKKQAEMDLARGNIKADDYEAVTGEKAPSQLVEKGLRAAKGLVKGMVKKAVSPTMLDPEGAAEKAKSYDLADAATDAGLAALGPAGLVAKGLGLDKYAKKAVKYVTDPLTGAVKSVTDPAVDAISGAVSPITKPITDKLKAGQQAVMGATDEALGLNQGPVGFTEAAEALASDEELKSAPKPAPKPGGDRSSGAGKALGAAALGALAAKALQPKAKEPAAPAPAPEPAKGEPTDVKGEQQKLVDALKKQASGEESIAEKQIRRTQDRSLAQRLAALKSMRGQDSGSKLRSFSKASDKARREAEGQIEIAGMKERRSAQDQLRAQLNTMSQAEATERWNKINRDDRQRLLKMRREDAIKRGEFTKWLTVAAMGQKFFPDQIKGVGDWVGTNVLDPVVEGGKTLLKKGGDFISSVFSADGGYISGPGTETSDSIPARLSDGEFVVKASAVRGLGKSMGAKGKEEERKKGVDFLYKLQDKMDKAEKFAKGGEAYVRPKKAFREAIGYEGESRFHDKAAKDAKHGGARRKFRHFQQGGPVSLEVKGMKPQFNTPQSQGFGSVVAAQKDLQRRLEELERQLGR
jgi:hypothetical protein